MVPSATAWHRFCPVCHTTLQVGAEHYSPCSFHSLRYTVSCAAHAVHWNNCICLTATCVQSKKLLLDISWKMARTPAAKTRCFVFLAALYQPTMLVHSHLVQMLS